jgi:hypothetical protein
MSCEDCEKAQDEEAAFYYRIGPANVQVRGCREHVQDMFGRLRAYGVRKEEADSFGRPLVKCSP